MGKLQVPGQPREGGRGTWHQPAQTYPAALAKHSLSFLQDFCHFPAKTPPHSRPQDCRAFNHTRGASRGVRQGGWRWLRSQIPTSPSILEQGAHLKVTPWLSWSLPASSSPQSRTGRCPSTCVGSHSSLQGNSGERTSPVDPRPCCHQQMHHSPLRFSNPHLPESCAWGRLIFHFAERQTLSPSGCTEKPAAETLWLKKQNTKNPYPACAFFFFK